MTPNAILKSNSNNLLVLINTLLIIVYKKVENKGSLKYEENSVGFGSSYQFFDTYRLWHKKSSNNEFE